MEAGTMSEHLWTLLDDYLTRAERSEAALARQIGVKPQTISTWKHRGFKLPPEPTTLRALARVLGAPYTDVLDAALRDTGYLGTGEGLAGASDQLADLTAVQRALVLGIVQELRTGGPEASALVRDRIAEPNPSQQPS